MNILINAISARLGGGQTYLVNLLKRLPVDEGINVYLLAPQHLELHDLPANLTRLNVSDSLVTGLFRRTLWEQFKLAGLLRTKRIDVLFCPGGSLNGNFTGLCKTAVTFQNMLPFDKTQVKKYGLSFSRLRNILLKSRLLQSMKKTDLVIFISEYGRTVVEGLLDKKLKKTALIPHGIDPLFRKSSDSILPLPSWLPENGYLLYVSPLDVYKAQLEVVKGYGLLRSKGGDVPKLVLVGTPLNKKYKHQVMALVSELGLENDIINKGHVDYQFLPAVFQNATINIFASETENCPFILLEALSAGRPLLSSNRKPMPEFAGEAAMYFDPSDSNELAGKLYEILNDKILIKKLSELSLAKSNHYDWDKSAKNTWDALLELGAS
jgi:glycosyltransferase involved in cell wall biosynthesis